MKFLLTALKLLYVLDSNLMPSPIVSDEDTNEIKAQRKKQEEDELICRGHILNTLSDRLYDLYPSMKSLKEIWNALEQGSQYRTGGYTGLASSTIYFRYRSIPVYRFGFTAIFYYFIQYTKLYL